MIFQAHIHRYNQNKTKLDTKTIEVEANCLESFWKKAVIDNGYINHSLHFLTRADDRNYLYRVKIIKRYKTETDFLWSNPNGRKENVPNVYQAE
jgi:regulation of enolase protein 1 (concanavalin A-like superfamily)